ncbi:hypothetical protein KKH18_03560 [bacterium]|nr:hypothetical protein [bacterium]
MNKSSLLLLCCLFLAATAISQPASRSAFFVANEGQWPGEFAFRYDGGGGSWFVTKYGLTIDLKRYKNDGFMAMLKKKSVYPTKKSWRKGRMGRSRHGF